MRKHVRSLLRFLIVLGAAAIAQSITHSWWQFLIITAIVPPLWLLERRLLPINAPPRGIVVRSAPHR